jgi:acyl-CoA reductase-like NAD-dependent aldehyde dehydrogenase
MVCAMSHATHPEHFTAPEHLKPDSGEAVVEHSRLGVLFGVHPWNSPFYQFARSEGPNPMAGNFLMVTHSNIDSDVHAYRVALFGPVALFVRVKDEDAQVAQRRNGSKVSSSLPVIGATPCPKTLI